MSNPEPALSYSREHQAASLQTLKELLRIPSISTLPEHRVDVEAAARWLATRLDDLDFEAVTIHPTDGHPIVTGQWSGAGPASPTMLVYGHYDVQPADPLALWESPPFQPEIRDDNIYARGASDMKAPIVSHLVAVDSMLRTSGLLVNVKYLFEGEEEIGSPHLEAFVTANTDSLGCDFCLNLDSSILSSDTPSLHYALRGIAYFELRVKGPAHDLHSGQFGGVVDNPALILAQLIAGMRNESYQITLPGFYDDVRDLSPEERVELGKLPQDEPWWQQAAGLNVLAGEPGYSPTERATARPTLEINGLLSGFAGAGTKTIIPAEAMAKISMRLVPDQSPDKVHTALRAHLEAHAPPTITWELEEKHSSRPVLMRRDSTAVQAAGRALEAVWGKLPLFTREGGTVPVVGLLQDALHTESLMLGFGLPDDDIHAPNEKFYLPNFQRGIEAYIRLAHELAG